MKEKDIEDVNYVSSMAENASWPSLDAQIEQRTAGLNEFMVESARKSLVAVKVQAVEAVWKWRNYVLNKKAHSLDFDKDLEQLSKVFEYKDGKLQYVSDYLQKLKELNTERFETQAAVDIYNQHVRAYNEVKKLYSLIKNNYVRKVMAKPQDFFVLDDGEIYFAESLDYALMAKKRL